MEAVNSKKNYRILVLGAGGLGCELLVKCCLNGFEDITVIDYDRIEITNLNRQFLFYEHDVGESKSQCAAARISKRFDIQIHGIDGRVQDFTTDFFASFDVVFGGVDNLEARSYVNKCLMDGFNSSYHHHPSVKYPVYIDGGTTGLAGQVQVMIPGKTPCFECLKSLFPDHPDRFPLCSLVGVPQTAEQCVLWSSTVGWEKAKESMSEQECVGIWKDDRKFAQWVFDHAVVKASELNILNVTHDLCESMLQRVTPAESTTNSIIAGIMVSVAVHHLEGKTELPYNYILYNGENDIFFDYLLMEKSDSCMLCNQNILHIQVVNDNVCLFELIDMCLNRIVEDSDTRSRIQVMDLSSYKRFGLWMGSVPLVVTSSSAFEAMSKSNLERSLSVLGIVDGCVLSIFFKELSFSCVVHYLL